MGLFIDSCVKHDTLSICDWFIYTNWTGKLDTCRTLWARSLYVSGNRIERIIFSGAIVDGSVLLCAVTQNERATCNTQLKDATVGETHPLWHIVGVDNVNIMLNTRWETFNSLYFCSIHKTRRGRGDDTRGSARTYRIYVDTYTNVRAAPPWSIKRL